ncbi:MAG: molybdopterin-binding protein [Clostridiales bacterium]|nr:molybdopterin-binding protein [Clostridiales bacterium]MDY3764989.1 molybdopterin-binding protein [Candidatus Ventricola sp.]MCI7703006.1 molybdopterin-binding protein [Clostridiales bacterium]MDY3831833.1 molybdopterin-binding protein [Candidatus Ventricola sp.]MDY4541700.1 molybdopterin-binding protein [Candidatus Ventricola sp.]
MKKIPVEQAVGMTLCHDITKMVDGFKGAAFRRGHVIREEDIEELLNIGKKTVFVWEENAGEIHEEDCALRMAAMAPVQGAHYTAPSEGKVLLMADTRGMLRVDTELLREINSIGDITISTLPDHYPVESGARLASMRIVPLVTKEEQIIAAERLCAQRKLLDLRPYAHKKIGVIITGSEVYSGRIKDKFEPVVRRKMESYPAEILGVTICDDDLDMIINSAKAYLAKGADFLIFTGGMSVDPDDLTPTAIRRLGAQVVSHGVPSQPGNMTLVAYLSDVAILGVPGAAISLPTTIFDVLLPQIFTGDKLTKDDLIRLGDGGLCQMCRACHFPNCTFGRY